MPRPGPEFKSEDLDSSDIEIIKVFQSDTTAIVRSVKEENQYGFYYYLNNVSFILLIRQLQCHMKMCILL